MSYHIISIPTDSQWGNAIPLGMVALGMALIFYNLFMVGAVGKSSALTVLMFSTGGLAQFFAGIIEYFRHSTFGYTSFGLMGSFFICLVLEWYLPTTDVLVRPDDSFKGFHMLLWTLMIAILLVCTVNKGYIYRILYGSLFLMFFFSSIAYFTSTHAVHIIGGIFGFLAGVSAFYFGLAELVNETHKREVIPSFSHCDSNKRN